MSFAMGPAGLRALAGYQRPYYEADDLAAILLNRKLSQAALVGSSHGAPAGVGLIADPFATQIAMAANLGKFIMCDGPQSTLELFS